MTSDHPRARVTELISDKIIAQELPAGRSAGEEMLARELGVSRTPVREALLGLEADGMVRSRRGQGFVVLPLDRGEAEQIYPIVAALERLAVESSGPATADLMAKLHAANAALAAAGTAQERMKADAAWHRLMVSGCRNDRLKRLIESVKRTILRYEFAYLKDSELRDTSLAEHEQMAALLAAEPRQAAAELERHWLRGMRAVVAMFRGGEG